MVYIQEMNYRQAAFDNIPASPASPASLLREDGARFFAGLSKIWQIVVAAILVAGGIAAFLIDALTKDDLPAETFSLLVSALGVDFALFFSFLIGSGGAGLAHIWASASGDLKTFSDKIVGAISFIAVLAMIVSAASSFLIASMEMFLLWQKLGKL